MTVNWKKINMEIKREESRVAMVSMMRCPNLIFVLCFRNHLVLGPWWNLTSVLFLVTKSRPHWRSFQQFIFGGWSRTTLRVWRARVYRDQAPMAASAGRASSKQGLRNRPINNVAQCV